MVNTVITFQDRDPYPKFELIQETDPGVTPGSPTAAAWTKRSLETLTNTIVNSSVSASVVTLPAGSYEIAGWQSFTQAGQVLTRLRDTTNTSTLGLGFATDGDAGETSMIIMPTFTTTFAATVNIEFQYYVTSASTLGVSTPVGSAENGRHAQLNIVRIS